MAKIKSVWKILGWVGSFYVFFQGKKNQRGTEGTSRVFGAEAERGENAECYKISKRGPRDLYIFQFAGKYWNIKPVGNQKVTWRWVIASVDLRRTNMWSKGNFIFSGISLCCSAWQLISNPGKHSLAIFPVAWSRKLTVSTIPLNQRVPEKLFSVAAIQGFCCKCLGVKHTSQQRSLVSTQELSINWKMCFHIN